MQKINPVPPNQIVFAIENKGANTLIDSVILNGAKIFDSIATTGIVIRNTQTLGYSSILSVYLHSNGGAVLMTISTIVIAINASLLKVK